MNTYDFTNSKMFDAFIELNRQMIERDLPKRQLIVVGGFALMILEKWYLYAVPVDV